MSADFTKILVKDDRLEVVDNIKYAVIKGGQNVTMAPFQAISSSDSQLVFNIQVPSEQTIIDRRVLLQTDLTLTVQSVTQNWNATQTQPGPPIVPGNVAGVAPTVGNCATTGCGYGQYAALAPYPLHQLMTVASATINNNTVSINIRDVLPFIIRALDKGDLNAYNGCTSTAINSFLSYTAGVALASNPLGSCVPTLDTDMAGSGSLYLKNYAITVPTAAAPNNFVTTEVFTFHISEPLLLSPFIYCNPKSNAQGFYGIQNMNFVLNMGEANRVFRGLYGVNGLSAPSLTGATATSNPNAVYVSPAGNANTDQATAAYKSLPSIVGVSKGNPASGISAFSNTFLLFTFLTPHPSDLMPARNIVPYYELPRYITQLSPPAPKLYTSAGGNVIYQGVDTLGGTVISSQTLQLNQIPDKLVIMVRKPMGESNWADSDSYLPIRGISVQFNNNAGILSSARCEDLYRMSKDNGSNQNWNEWVGVVNASVLDVVSAGGPNISYPSNVCATTQGTSSPIFVEQATCGSCLMLEFGKDIQLVEDFFAPGSLGNFNLQFQVRVENFNPSIPITSQVEVVMITMNSGVFVCERGTSSTYTGILTRADVLEASEQDAYSRSDVKRMVGGGFLDQLKSGVAKLAPLLKAVAPMAKEYLGSKGSMGKLASAGIGALGYGATGAGSSGGGRSGGALQGRYM